MGGRIGYLSAILLARTRPPSRSRQESPTFDASRTVTTAGGLCRTAGTGRRPAVAEAFLGDQDLACSVQAARRPNQLEGIAEWEPSSNGRDPVVGRHAEPMGDARGSSSPDRPPLSCPVDGDLSGSTTPHGGERLVLLRCGRRQLLLSRRKQQANGRLGLLDQRNNAGSEVADPPRCQKPALLAGWRQHDQQQPTGACRIAGFLGKIRREKRLVPPARTRWVGRRRVLDHQDRPVADGRDGTCRCRTHAIPPPRGPSAIRFSIGRSGTRTEVAGLAHRAGRTRPHVRRTRPRPLFLLRMIASLASSTTYRNGGCRCAESHTAVSAFSVHASRDSACGWRSRVLRRAGRRGEER